MESGFVRHPLNQLILKVLPVSKKCRTSRPPSVLLLESTPFWSSWDLFSHMKSKKNNLFAHVAVDSLTNMDKAGCTKQDRPSALERRTPPNADKSIWSQVLKINLFQKFWFCYKVFSYKYPQISDGWYIFNYVVIAIMQGQHFTFRHIES